MAQSREDKQAHERRIFVEFCRAAGLPVAIDSIRQSQPPEPDSLADIEGQDGVAFELVRLNYDDEILGTNLLIESSRFLAAEFAKLAEPQRSRLAAMYDDTHVLLQLRPNATPLHTI